MSCLLFGSVKYVRNKSLTRDEIDEFWKSKKQAVEEHLKSAYPQHVKKEEEQETQVIEKTLQRSTSMPLPRRKETIVQHEHRLTKTDCWWTASNSAFLNEPSVMETEGLSIRKQHASFYCGHMIGKQKLIDNNNTQHHITT